MHVSCIHFYLGRTMKFEIIDKGPKVRVLTTGEGTQTVQTYVVEPSPDSEDSGERYAHL